MSKEEKLSNRDMTLISVLDRMGDRIAQLETRLEGLEQANARLLHSMDYRQDLQLGESDAALKRMSDDLRRYRSDMMGLAGDQSRVEAYTKNMAALQKTLASAQEEIARDLSRLDERVATREKAAHEHAEHSAKKSEALSKEIAGVDAHVTRLFQDSEKSMTIKQRETLQKLDKLRIETERRLLALDKIEDVLEILLIRTEPPVKKAFLPLRLLRRVTGAVKALFRPRKRGAGNEDESGAESISGSVAVEARAALDVKETADVKEAAALGEVVPSEDAAHAENAVPPKDGLPSESAAQSKDAALGARTEP